MADELTQEQRLEKAEKELFAEVEEWDRINVNINAVVNTNPVATEIGFKELVRMLDELIPDFDMQEFLIRWRVATLNDLKRIRLEHVMPQVMKNKHDIELPKMAIPGEKKIHLQ